MDRIHINRLMARAIIGLNKWERDKKQELAISVILDVDLRPAGASDQLADTVDYKAIKNRILELVENSEFLLIERLADAIAQLCLDEPKVERVNVTVDKLGALRFARSVAVEITRDRNDV